MEALMENQLQTLVSDAKLPPSKSQVILERFKDYFAMAAEWETKAKTIKVTDASQTCDMALARTGRLFLREKRIAIEKARKGLKEQLIREGKAIEGIANVLKALIVPIEKYLEQQEKFVELKAKAEEEERQRESDRIAEENRIAQEKADAEEKERLRADNARLQAEADERDRLAEEERKAKDAELQAERDKHQEELRIKEEKAEKEKCAAAKKAEAKQRAAKIKLDQEREERERLVEALKKPFPCPKCSHQIDLTKII
jgi:hypothetical protein